MASLYTYISSTFFAVTKFCNMYTYYYFFQKSSLLCESLHSLYLECIRSSFLSYSISKVRKDFRFVHANFICIKVDTSTSMQTLEFKAKNCSESFPNWQLLIVLKYQYLIGGMVLLL